MLSPNGTMAITVPRFGPELVNWALSEEYYDVPGGHVRLYRRSILFDRLRAAGLEPFASHHAHGLHSPYWWLKCAVGPRRTDSKAVNSYQKMLEWEIINQPAAMKVVERGLAPVLGKSYIIYGIKQ